MHINSCSLTTTSITKKMLTPIMTSAIIQTTTDHTLCVCVGGVGCTCVWGVGCVCVCVGCGGLVMCTVGYGYYSNLWLCIC